MTAYYILCGDKNHGTLANMRSSNTEFIDALEDGKTFTMKRIPRDEQTTDDQRLLIEITEILDVNTGSIYVEAQRQHSEVMKPHVVQNTQATAEAKKARVLEEIAKDVLPLVQRVKIKAETHPTDRAIAEWIVLEKTKHTSLVSRAYDTGEAGSIEKYTEEVQSIVRMTLDILEGGGHPSENSMQEPSKMDDLHTDPIATTDVKA